MGATYLKELQDIVRKYRAETQIGLVTSREIAVWAIKNKLWSMGEAQIINRCADDLARAMREEYIIDPQGRKVRAKHAAKVPVNERQCAPPQPGRCGRRWWVGTGFQWKSSCSHRSRIESHDEHPPR